MKRIGLMIVCALATLSPLLFLGCEVESSADTQLNLTPRSVTLNPFQSATFTVSGGYDYRWSLQTETLGILNKRTGNQVVYTSTSTNAGTQQLTVESFILGATGNNPTNIAGSNSIVGVTAVATITHSGGSVVTPPSALTVIPSSATLSFVGQTITFQTVGGLNCKWSVQTPLYGYPDVHTGSTFTYVCNYINPSSSVSQVIDVVYTPHGGTPLSTTVTVVQKAP